MKRTGLGVSAAISPEIFPEDNSGPQWQKGYDRQENKRAATLAGFKPTLNKLEVVPLVLPFGKMKPTAPLPQAHLHTKYSHLPGGITPISSSSDCSQAPHPPFLPHLPGFRVSFHYRLLGKIGQGQAASLGIASSTACPFLLRPTLDLPEIAPAGLHLPMSPLWNKIHIPCPRHGPLKNLEVIMDPGVTADSRC